MKKLPSIYSELESDLIDKVFKNNFDKLSPHFFKLMVDELERFFQGHQTWFDLTTRSKANREGEVTE